MTDSVDELLAQMKATYGDEAKPDRSSPVPGAPSPSSSPSSAHPGSATADRSLDHLLADLDGSPALNPRHQPAPSPPQSSKPEASADPLLSQLKTQYTDHDQAIALQKQAQLEAEQRQQQRVQQQRRAALTKRAQTWLKQLDPHGGEGVWFEEFAANYPSRLDAAIDYLGVSDEP